MLHLATVEPRTLELLKNLMAEPELAAFNLVGGTALSLQIGHRKSVDLDLFGYPPELNAAHISGILSDFGQVEESKISRNIMSVYVDGIKVDLVRYQYPLLQPVTVVDGIRLVSLPDIAAMKLSAIAGRGRKRDFIDLFFLLKQFKLAEILDFHSRKYADGNRFLILKSLQYFADAEHDEDLLLHKPADWQTVKTTIDKAVLGYLK